MPTLQKKTMIRFSLFAFAALLAMSGTHAQSEVEVFSEMGDAFTLYLNQVKMNDAPAARVLAEVDPGYYQVRVDFEQDGRPDILKNNFGTEQGMRTTGKITVNRKGAYVIRPFAFVPIASAPAAVAEEPVAPAASSTNMTMSVEGPGTTTTEQVSMNVNVGGGLVPGGINMNVQMTATETTSGSTSWTDTSDGWEEEPATSGMDDVDFADYLAAIRAKTFEDSKASTAESPLKAGAMLSSAQVAQVMQAFEFESTRLDFAVFAHQRCVDPQNYYKTHGAFEFELSIDELNEAIGQ